MFTKPNEELVAGNHLFGFPQGFLQLLKFRRKILFRGDRDGSLELCE